MILGGKVVVENDAGGYGLVSPRQKLAPVRPEVMLIHNDERGEKSAEEQCAEEDTELVSLPVYVSKGKSEQDGQKVPTDGRNPRAHPVVGEKTGDDNAY